MFLYRALNSDDIKNYNSNHNIYCSLFNNVVKDNVSKETIEYANKCFKGPFSNSLDSIIGHIGGYRLSSQSSPWISASTNFNHVASEYAIPQTGKNNKTSNRKPIALININNKKVLNNSYDIFKSRNEVLNDNCVIDLQDNNLHLFKWDGAINDLDNSKDMFNYDEASLQELSKLATESSEVLIYSQIYNNEVKEIIYPVLQDILYSTDFLKTEQDNTYLLNYFSFFENIIRCKLKDNDHYFMNILYPSYKEGINLTDFLIEQYDTIKGNTIEEKYESLKIVKKYAIEGFVKDINAVLDYSLEVKKIVDDEISVTSYEHLGKYNIRDISNLVVFEKDGNFYRYNSIKDTYDTLNGDSISKDDLVDTICNMQKIKRK